MTGMEYVDDAIDILERAVQYAQQGDWLLVLSTMRRSQESVVEATMFACQKALDSGITKKKMAAALDVPASTFRGMQKSNSRRGPQALSDLLQLNQ